MKVLNVVSALSRVSKLATSDDDDDDDDDDDVYRLSVTTWR